jgi:membrane protease YdiL (CAAX protease family)
MVGIVGMLAWRASTARVRAGRWLGVTAAGTLGFTAALALGEAAAPRALAFSVIAVTLAAVAEEAFFRRFLYGWLERWGPAVAVGVTAVAFGLIHVPVYGWSILALDVAAGAVLGWQRWASGSWTSAAVAHVVANLVVFL